MSPTHFAEHLTVMSRAGARCAASTSCSASRRPRACGPPANHSSASRSTTATSTTSRPRCRSWSRSTPRRRCSSRLACSVGRATGGTSSRSWSSDRASSRLGCEQRRRPPASSTAVGRRADARALHDLLHSRLIVRPVDAIEADLDRLATALGVDVPEPAGRPMTVAELRTLAAHPLVDIGVHTMTHPRLPDLPTSGARDEIDGCARQLDELLGARRRRARLSLRIVVARGRHRRRRPRLRARRHDGVALAAPPRRGAPGAPAAPARRRRADVRRVAPRLDLRSALSGTGLHRRAPR